MALRAGDIAWVELDPTMGTEQSGRRPALVISTVGYNEMSPRVLICPITTNEGDWPFNVPLPAGLRTRGVVLVDQVRSIDRAQRLFRVVEQVPSSVLDEVRGRLAAMVDG